jgi:Uncharacterized conserved protein
MRAAGGKEIRSITPLLDPGVFKNGFSCRIPGTKEQGNSRAAVLSAVGGDPEKGLRVLEGGTEDDVRQTKKLDAAGCVTVDIIDSLAKIHIEAIVETERGTARVLVKRRHDRIVPVEVNGEIVSKKNEDCSS